MVLKFIRTEKGFISKDLDNWNNWFELESKRNGIHIIMCGGDLLDGVFTKGTQIISDPYEQVKYFLENYPHDDSILTFSVGGDHDLSILNSACLDLSLITSNYRPDVIIPGYNNSFINKHYERRESDIIYKIKNNTYNSYYT